MRVRLLVNDTFEAAQAPGALQVVVFACTKEKARGRYPAAGYDKFALTGPLRFHILEVAMQHCLADASRSVRGVATAVLYELFSQRDADGNALRDENGMAVLKPLGRRPTLGQIRYLLRKALPVSPVWEAA